MTKRRRRAHHMGPPPQSQWAWKTVEMLWSPAFRALSLGAHRALARLELELARHGGAENGALPCTVDHFSEYGMHRHSVAPALRELEALGFIEVKRGRAGNGMWRSPNLYRLTYRPTDAADPTDDWKRIGSDAEAARIATEARKPESKRRWKSPDTNISPVPVSGTQPVPVSATSGVASPVPVSVTTDVAETVTTSISRGGDDAQRGAGSEVQDPSSSIVRPFPRRFVRGR